MSFLFNRTVPFGTAPFRYGYYNYPSIFPVYLSNIEKKMTIDELTTSVKKLVNKYVTFAINENKKRTKTDTEKKSPEDLRDEVKTAVRKAINDLLEEIVNEKIKISSGSTDGGAEKSKVFNLGTGKSKVLNLGTYVENINKELNDMINTGIPL